MFKVLVYKNDDGEEWGIGFLVEDSETHFKVVVDPKFRTHVQFPKKLYSFVHLTDSLNVL
jgi:hypothetical protein